MKGRWTPGELHGLYTKENKKSLEGLSWWTSGWDSHFQCRRRGFTPYFGELRSHQAIQYSQIIKGGGGRPLESFKEQFDLGHDIFL